MRIRTTLVLLAIVVAVAAFIKLVESKRPNTEEAQRQAGNVLNFDRDKLEGIIIQNGDDKTELRLRDNKWRVESPIKDQADNGAVSALISELESWHKDDTIPAKEVGAVKGRLEEYGLSKPKLRLKLLGPGNASGDSLRQRCRPRKQDVCALRKFKSDVYRGEFGQKRDREKAGRFSRPEVDGVNDGASFACARKNASRRNGIAEDRRTIGRS